jgi:hypothetical protein
MDIIGDADDNAAIEAFWGPDANLSTAGDGPPA